MDDITLSPQDTSRAAPGEIYMTTGGADPGAPPAIRIAADGRFFVHGVEVDTSNDAGRRELYNNVTKFFAVASGFPTVTTLDTNDQAKAQEAIQRAYNLVKNLRESTTVAEHAYSALCSQYYHCYGKEITIDGQPHWVLARKDSFFCKRRHDKEPEPGPAPL